MGYVQPAARFSGVPIDDPTGVAGRSFTGEQCEALFQAILIDDEVDDHTELPAVIRLDYTKRDLADCYGLARQLWETGFDRDLLVRVTATLLREGDLGGEDRLAFKHVRAKFKHLRYAHALYGTRAGYPPMLDRITITMGHLQDGFRNRQRRAVILHATLLRIWLTRPFVARLHREADRLVPVAPATFRAMLERDTRRLAVFAATDRVTGRELHAARKIIGRQVSFYDTMRTLQPSPDLYRMSRSLSAINGLMGSLHDTLIVAKTKAPGSYDEVRFGLPGPIRVRLAALVDRLS